MKFERNKNIWVAEGILGRFIIKKQYRMYYPKYESEDKNFNLPRCRLFSEAKEICKNNFYWED